MFSFHLIIVLVMCLYSQVEISDYLLFEMGRASLQSDIKRDISVGKTGSETTSQAFTKVIYIGAIVGRL